MDIMNRIIELLQAKGANQADLCKHLGVKNNVLTTWKTRGTDPPTKYLVQICDFLDVTLEYLLTGQNQKQPEIHLTDDERELLESYGTLSDINKARVRERAVTLAELEAPVESPVLDSRTIPYSVLKVSAGSGEYLDSVQMKPIRIVSNDRTAAADFAVKITGDSMEPQFSDGDIVLVKSQPAVELGQIGIFIIDGHGYIKQLGERELISLNPDYANIPLHEYQETECKGLVLGVLEPSDILS